MTRFDEVVRLKELQAAAKPGPWLVYNDPAIRCPTCKTEADGRYMMGLTHAPWLLDAVACFQSGDDTKIQRFLDNAELIYKQDYASDLSEIEFREFKEVLIRLQKAAAIMEDLE